MKMTLSDALFTEPCLSWRFMMDLMRNDPRVFNRNVDYMVSSVFVQI